MLLGGRTSTDQSPHRLTLHHAAVMSSTSRCSAAYQPLPAGYQPMPAGYQPQPTLADYQPQPPLMVRSLGHSLDDELGAADVTSRLSGYNNARGRSEAMSSGYTSRPPTGAGPSHISKHHDHVEAADSLYKRHHSTGDMLLATAATITAVSDAHVSDRRNGADTTANCRTSTSLRMRPLRPKSDGNLSVASMKARRASSFGVCTNTPFKSEIRFLDVGDVFLTLH